MPLFLISISICVVGLVNAALPNLGEARNEIPEWNNLIYGYSSHRCHVIPEEFSLCNNIGYSKMILPNFLQHETIAEATASSKDWQRLTEFNCHNDTRRFLCSLYAPVCVPNEPVRKIQPCRELCLSVKKACSPSMLTFGYKWPDILHCDKFPQKFAGLCIRGTEGAVQNGPNVTLPGDNWNSSSLKAGCNCQSIFGSASINEHYCSATTVIRAKVSRLRTVNHSKHLIRLHRKSKIIKANSTDLPFLAAMEIGCLCDQIDSDKIRRGRWLLMGVVRDRAFIVTSLTRWRKNSKEFKKTVRRLKKLEPQICGSRFRPSDRRMAGLSISGQKMRRPGKTLRRRRATPPTPPHTTR